jgi:hypothetical protein
MGNDTEILNKHPLLKAVVDHAIDKLLYPLLLAVIVGGCNHLKESSDTKWIGQHLNEKQRQIDEIKANQ